LVIALLQTEKLPVEDLPPTLDNFYVALKDNTIIGAIGLEQYGNYALLRSAVVSREHRNKNIASNLVDELENYGKHLGVIAMYLLTETAPAYFEKKGYQRIAGRCTAGSEAIFRIQPCMPGKCCCYEKRVASLT
jgi:amino-acid N-acetyltransferase